MLVLTRKLEENVIIDDVITVKVLKVQGRAVRLGIEAPSDVSIRRGELRREPRPAQVVGSSDDEQRATFVLAFEAED